MPNWCYTTLNIRGSEEKIKELSALVKTAEEKEGGLCNLLIPRPAAEDENWYNWNVDNWGSKWDVHYFLVEYEDDAEISLSFSTAWSQITPIFDELVKRGFSVFAEFRDECYAFVGEYEDGDTIYFETKLCEDCQELDEPNEDCECEGEGVIVLR